MYQKHILDLLRTSRELRYSELQPYGVESSHFKYHLDQLLQEDTVVRVNRGVYALSAKGRMMVDRLSEGRIHPHQTPKVITYTLLRRSNDYYLYRKKKDPFLGTITMVSGKVHLNERTHDAAVREVYEKTGLNVKNLELKLVAEVRIYESEELASHFVAYVFVADFNGESKNLEKYTGDEIAARNDLAPDLLQILRALSSEQKFLDIDCIHTL